MPIIIDTSQSIRWLTTAIDGHVAQLIVTGIGDQRTPFTLNLGVDNIHRSTVSIAGLVSVTKCIDRPYR